MTDNVVEFKKTNKPEAPVTFIHLLSLHIAMDSENNLEVEMDSDEDITEQVVYDSLMEVTLTYGLETGILVEDDSDED